jgi:hypothetical protein
MASSSFVFKIIIIALPAIFLFAPKVFAESSLIINEIMYDLPGTDATHEWIELFNAGSSEIDLTDWKFNDGDDATNHGLNPPPKNGSRGSLIIPPNGYLILAGSAETLVYDLPNYNGSVIDTVMSLPNTAGVLKILNKENQEVASVSYNKETGANGNNKTLEWDGSVLKESAQEGGTPGGKNSVLLQNYSPALPIDNASSSNTSFSDFDNPSLPEFSNYSDEVLINEFMPWSSSGNEWVELLNSGNQTIDLSGWQIDDAPGASPPQKISAGTLIKPGAFLVIELEKNILNNDGDEARLIWPDSQLLHSVAYKNARLNLSSGRFENGSWLWTDQPTPGLENKKSAQKSSLLKTENAVMQSALPAITAIFGAVSQEKNEKNSSGKNIAAAADTNTAEGQVSPQNQTAASQSSVAQKIAAKNSGFSPLLALAAIAVLSLLSGIGIVYFKRKLAPPKQPPISK